MKKSPNQLYWEAMEKKRITDNYHEFLIQTSSVNNSDSAHVFVLRLNHNDRNGMSERDLILMLAGDLPYMYD